MSTGVLLLTYGTSETSDGVEDYLRSVYRGEPPAATVTEFKRRFDLIGRSPLIDITHEQCAGLQALLDREYGAGAYVVDVGMLHTAPRIADGLARLVAAGVERVVGIVLAPQYSALIMGGYNRAVEEAVAAKGVSIPVAVAGAWHDVPGWTDSLAERVGETLDAVGDLPVVFTAHSLPESVVTRDLAYLDQIHATIAGVVDRLELPDDRWQFGYQSAGHTPEEWLQPDFKDLVPGLAERGFAGVVFVPVQFVADNLETLYDIDIAGREEAEEVGLAFHRVPVPNASPSFIEALRQVVQRETVVTPAA
jgi:protoporphyrin/coproporphyrin ferrochelatase